MRNAEPASQVEDGHTAGLRVLHVINSLVGSGGAEQGLVREITHFDSSVKSVVVRLFDGDDLEPTLTANHIKVISLGLSSSHAAWNWPEAVRRVRRIIHKFRPDVIQTSLFTGNLVGQLAAAGTGIPVLSTLTLTGDQRLHRQLQPGANTRKAALLRRLGAWVGRRSYVRYRAVSEDTARTNCGALRLDRSRIAVIPRGIDLSPFTPDRGRFGLPEGVPLLVNVGRNTAQKGQVFLIRAFRQVIESCPEAHLAIAGSEGDASRLIQQEIDALGLRNSVHLLGYRSDIGVLLASADLFLFTSLAEGLGTAVLEAMGAQLPIVAFDIPPLREICQASPSSRLVKVGDVKGLSSAALETLRSDVGPNHAFSTARFAIDVVAREVQELLLQVAGVLN